MPIPNIGQFTASIGYKAKESQAGFVVVKGKEECHVAWHNKYGQHTRNWFDREAHESAGTPLGRNSKERRHI